MTRTRIDLIAGETTFASLKTFTEIEQLNKTVRQYKDMIADMKMRQDVKRNLLTVIEYIKRYSCRFFGVSWRGKRKIAADLKMSDKTVTRLCKRLESLGIVKQYAQKRSSDMQQTSNAIVIQPLKIEQKQENVRQEAREMSYQENNIFLKQNNLKPLRTENVADELISKIIPNWIDKDFARYASSYYSAKDIIEFARIALINGKKHSLKTHEVASIAIESFKQLVYKIKHGKVSNEFGLFTAIIRQKLKSAEINGLFHSVFDSCRTFSSVKKQEEYIAAPELDNAF